MSTRINFYGVSKNGGERLSLGEFSSTDANTFRQYMHIAYDVDTSFTKEDINALVDGLQSEIEATKTYLDKAQISLEKLVIMQANSKTIDIYNQIEQSVSNWKETIHDTICDIEDKCTIQGRLIAILHFIFANQEFCNFFYRYA